MKSILIVCAFIVLTLLGCKGKSKSTVTDGDFNIEFLFEKDGCKIYRFKDNGRFIYWANCEGRMSKDVYHGTGKISYTEHQQTIITK